jgi:hypothetical protein
MVAISTGWALGHSPATIRLINPIPINQGMVFDQRLGRGDLLDGDELADEDGGVFMEGSVVSFERTDEVELV